MPPKRQAIKPAIAASANAIIKQKNTNTNANSNNTSGKAIGNAQMPRQIVTIFFKFEAFACDQLVSSRHTK